MPEMHRFYPNSPLFTPVKNAPKSACECLNSNTHLRHLQAHTLNNTKGITKPTCTEFDGLVQ